MIADYISLIKLAKTKGRGGSTVREGEEKPAKPQTGNHNDRAAGEPIVVIMRPPPLWRDSDYGMNQTVLNDVMPRLVPTISALASLRHPPIDVYSALGGTPNWKATYPVCGCQEPPAPSGAGAPTLPSSLQPVDAATAAAAGPARASTARSDGTNFTATQGYLPMGGDFKVGNFT